MYFYVVLFKIVYFMQYLITGAKLFCFFFSPLFLPFINFSDA